MQNVFAVIRGTGQIVIQPTQVGAKLDDQVLNEIMPKHLI